MKDTINTRVISILIFVIIILLVFVLFTSVVKPAINAYVVKKQVEAKDIVLNAILTQIKQQGYTQITNIAEGEGPIPISLCLDNNVDGVCDVVQQQQAQTQQNQRQG